MEDSSKYIFYIVLVIQFILSLYIQNTKLEWAILSSLLVTIIITAGLFISYVNTPGNVFNIQMQTTLTVIKTLVIGALYLIPNKIYSMFAGANLKLPEPDILRIIFLLIPIILITVSIAIVINNKEKNIKKDTEAKIQTFNTVLLTDILIFTGVLLYIINIDRMKNIPRIEPVLQIMYIPYYILVKAPDFIIGKITGKGTVIEDSLLSSSTNKKDTYGLPIAGLTMLYGSSIWMMNSSVDIMDQYNKDK